jgi:hypothetical protein
VVDAEQTIDEEYEEQIKKPFNQSRWMLTKIKETMNTMRNKRRNCAIDPGGR